MVRILVLNNYTGRTQERVLRLKNSVERSRASATIVDAMKAGSVKLGGFDGVVLSGSYDMLSNPTVRKKYGAEIDLVRETTTPTLGVCFGHQLIGSAYGSEVVKAPNKALGYLKSWVRSDNALFSGLGASVSVYHSHYEILKSLPGGFNLIARSEASENDAMKHTRLPIYGVQFHPERNSSSNPDGQRIIDNFIRLTK
jgi:GMP synthase-like glutamine amidotransferase